MRGAGHQVRCGGIFAQDSAAAGLADAPSLLQPCPPWPHASSPSRSTLTPPLLTRNTPRNTPLKRPTHARARAARPARPPARPHLCLLHHAQLREDRHRLEVHAEGPQHLYRKCTAHVCARAGHGGKTRCQACMHAATVAEGRRAPPPGTRGESSPCCATHRNEMSAPRATRQGRDTTSCDDARHSCRKQASGCGASACACVRAYGIGRAGIMCLASVGFLGARGEPSPKSSQAVKAARVEGVVACGARSAPRGRMRGNGGGAAAQAGDILFARCTRTQGVVQPPSATTTPPTHPNPAAAASPGPTPLRNPPPHPPPPRPAP